jgi:hypothetical protein
LIVKETVTREIEVSFPEVVSLVRMLPVGQKEQLRKVLAEEEAGLSPEDEALLSGVLATFGEELGQPLSTEHTAVLAEARQAGTDDNARDAEAMWEVQREAYHRLNAEPTGKRRK